METDLIISGIRTAGLLSTLIGIGHIGFPRLFGWEGEFRKISGLNARVFNTLHLATTFFLIAAGLLTFRYAPELARSGEPATAACLALCLFWLWRFLWQVLYFRPSKLGNHLPLLPLHYLLAAAFAVLASCYGLPLLG